MCNDFTSINSQTYFNFHPGLVDCSMSVLSNCFDISVFQIHQNVISKQIINKNKNLFCIKNHKISRHLAANWCRINSTLSNWSIDLSMDWNFLDVWQLDKLLVFCSNRSHNRTWHLRHKEAIGDEKVGKLNSIFHSSN